MSMKTTTASPAALALLLAGLVLAAAHVAAAAETAMPQQQAKKRYTDLAARADKARIEKYLPGTLAPIEKLAQEAAALEADGKLEPSAAKYVEAARKLAEADSLARDQALIEKHLPGVLENIRKLAQEADALKAAGKAAEGQAKQAEADRTLAASRKLANELEVEHTEAYWALEFENDTPKPLVLADVPKPEELKDPTKGGLVYYWYLIYRVRNPHKRPLPTRLDLTLELQLAKDTTVYRDTYSPIAERHLKDEVPERRLLNWVAMRREFLEPGGERQGVAIFPVGDRAPDFDLMTIRVRGLAARRPLGRPTGEGAETNVRKFRERVLLIKYQYVASRWARGKELKYLPEEWELETVDVLDRTDAQGTAEPTDLQELYEKMKKERERLQEAGEKPTPQSAAPLPGIGLVTGKPDPELLAKLRAQADQLTSVRAAYTEIVGPQARRRTSSGTLYFGKGHKFAIERVPGTASGRSLKELRVFDGESLWTHTTAKDVGDAVRRWKAEATKPEWRSVPGGADAGFAAVVNPALAWRVFGDDLVHLGIEQLDAEAAHVFEARPGDQYRGILQGPLSGELLALALGRRVRFWVGTKTGFQHRLRVYDDQQNLVGSLECFAVELDAHIDAARFAFSPPTGVEVIDMNAAMADNGAPAPAPHQP
jgi:outer membrane lipoprotein-sorting protein